MDKNFSKCIPTLRVEDAIRSCEFYCDVLGFHKDWQHQFGSGYPLFVSVSRGSVTLYLTEHSECSFGSLVYFPVRDVGALAEEFQAKGAVLDLGPVDQPWGMYEIHLSDPDGNKLRFGQNISKN